MDGYIYIAAGIIHCRTIHTYNRSKPGSHRVMVLLLYLADVWSRRDALDTNDLRVLIDGPGFVFNATGFQHWASKEESC